MNQVAPTPPPSGGDVLVHSPGLVVTGGLTLILNGFTVKDTLNEVCLLSNHLVKH